MRTGSTLTVSNYAKVLSEQNAQFGLVADNVTVTLVNCNESSNLAGVVEEPVFGTPDPASGTEHDIKTSVTF